MGKTAKRCLMLVMVVVMAILTVVGCSNKSTQTEGGNEIAYEQESSAQQESMMLSATNPPAIKKVERNMGDGFEEDAEEEVEEKIPNKKKTLAKRKLNSETQREKTADGDMLSFMKKLCKKYGCSGSSSPNFYKVLQDTAQEYGISIAQAQAAWEN